MPASPEDILKATEIFEDKMRRIEEELKPMKRTVRAGGQVSQADLDMYHENLDRLDALIDEQKRMGH